MKAKLKKVVISGFKSVSQDKEHELKIELGDVNLLLGANGAGKSNIIGFFQDACFNRTKPFPVLLSLTSLNWDCIRLQSAKHTQIIIATQSPGLVDEFDPEQITVIEADKKYGYTTACKLKKEELKDWLENYSLSELWDKNVIGGRP
jgi:predicted ATPase